MLLKAAYRQASEKRRPSNKKLTYRMLHAVIELDLYLPPRALNLAIKLHPEQLRRTDEINGRLPLANVAASPSPRAHQIIALLIEACPQAAREVDADGQTALAIAIGSGKHWDEGVETIFRAAPDMLGRRDDKIGLYPALAAVAFEEERDEVDSCSSLDPQHPVSKKNTLNEEKHSANPLQDSSSSQDDAALKCLTTVYELIRADPSVVNW